VEWKVNVAVVALVRALGAESIKVSTPVTKV